MGITTCIKQSNVKATRSFRAALPAIAWFIFARITSLFAISIAVHIRGQRSIFQHLTYWDALWYESISTKGYGVTKIANVFYYNITTDGTNLSKFSGRQIFSDYAFFPLFPKAMHYLGKLGFGLEKSNLIAGLLINNIAALIAAWGIYVLAKQLFNHRVAVISVALWAALPPAGILSFAYSEGLFIALAAWALVAVTREYWLTAALLAVFAGVTRPQGAPLAAAISLAALWHLWQQKSWSWRPLLALVTAPLGFLFYMGWVGYRHHSITGYFQVQSGWKNKVDGGYGFIKFIIHNLQDNVILGIFICSAVLVIMLSFIYGIKHQWPLPIILYTGLIIIISTIPESFFASRPRYLLPAFPLVFPLALILARYKEIWQKVFLILWMTAGATAAGWYLTEYFPP